MPTDVLMPKMGESITEGTVVRWVKKIGETVNKDEPLFEISTDKVDAEIPAPAEGVVTEIRTKEGETVPVDTIVAVITHAGEDQEKTANDCSAHEVSTDPHLSIPEQSTVLSEKPDASVNVVADVPVSSPLVRRMAKEHGIKTSEIKGSGAGGRVTRQDVLAHLDVLRRAESNPQDLSVDTTAYVPKFGPGKTIQAVPMSIMRRTVADHMIRSRKTSAHVHSVIEVDFSRVVDLKQSLAQKYEAAGVKSTYLAFVVKAVVSALRSVPILNASIEEDHVVYKKEINLGIAVALEDGLIVPVIKNADEKNLLELSQSIAKLAARARTKQLEPKEVTGGTFTITNSGVFGTLLGTPIINQPQVAILNVGVVEKRPVVVDEAIVIRSCAYLTLGFDHRLIDGAVADYFLSHVRNQLEEFGHITT